MLLIDLRILLCEQDDLLNAFKYPKSEVYYSKTASLFVLKILYAKLTINYEYNSRSVYTISTVHVNFKDNR